MKRILLVAVLTASAIVAVPAVAASAGSTVDGRAPIAHRCSPVTTRQFAGELTGQDGLGVNATVGIDLVTATGQSIDLGGCPTGGYAAPLELNHYVGFAGQKIGTVQRDKNGVAHGTVSPKWAVYNLPANASAAWIETYARGYAGSPCTTCAGPAGFAKYGWVNRRVVPVSQYVRLVAPTTPAYGGSTGQIQATLVGSNGKPMGVVPCSPTRSANCVQVYTWSTNAPEGSMAQGWGPGIPIGVGQYRFQALASARAGQTYVIWIIYYGPSGTNVRTVKANTKAFLGYTTQMSIHV